MTYLTNFAAAHRLPDHPKCGTVHGHTYHVEVTYEGPIDSSKGWIMDSAIMKQEVESVVAQFDHKYLNEVLGPTIPTAEMIAAAILVSLRNLRKQDDRPSTSGYRKVRLWETPSFYVEVEK